MKDNNNPKTKNKVIYFKIFVKNQKKDNLYQKLVVVIEKKLNVDIMPQIKSIQSKHVVK